MIGGRCLLSIFWCRQLKTKLSVRCNFLAVPASPIIRRRGRKRRERTWRSLGIGEEEGD
jgi:hypothetical protein